MPRTGRPKSPPETVRECLGCKDPFELNATNFAPQKAGRNGFDPRCRPCMGTYRRAYKALMAPSASGALSARVARLKALPPLRDGQICGECSGLAHRRPDDGCPRCRGSYAPESLPELETRRYYQAAV